MEIDEWQDPQDLLFKRRDLMNKPITYTRTIQLFCDLRIVNTDAGKHKEGE